MITFVTGAAYDGAHFAWFAERYDDYCYLDRIVIHEEFQRRGLGTFAYDELEGSCGRPVFALEVNIDPPNEPSLAFHRARGFTEVGQSDASGHLVSLMVKQLSSNPASRASTMACARCATWSLAKMLLEWLRIVLTERCSSRAISELSRLSAIRRSTWRSRSVSSGNSSERPGSPRHGSRCTRSAIAGPKMTSPAPTASIERRISVRRAPFSR